MVYLDDNVKLWSSEAQGFMFMHLEVRDWSPSAYKEIKEVLPTVLGKARDGGHELVFATTEDERILKMFNRMLTPYTIEKMKSQTDNWICAWETGG